MCEKFPNATQFGETARKIYSDLTDSDCQIARIHPFAVPLFDSYVDWERSAFPIELLKKNNSVNQIKENYCEEKSRERERT